MVDEGDVLPLVFTPEDNEVTEGEGSCEERPAVEGHFNFNGSTDPEEQLSLHPSFTPIEGAQSKLPLNLDMESVLAHPAERKVNSPLIVFMKRSGEELGMWESACASCVDMWRTV
ncbi:hypothetical protein DPX16_22480 [Anabarilius grahami]|uniref:Uncharacterized protein n=1 Tax=Anabarilius grahami TaxID=495550 RepID=A0A3N0YZU0_ANAGA|nr:hypothetical protein DPX16_22480 [Anabarilius grahami]